MSAAIDTPTDLTGCCFPCRLWNCRRCYGGDCTREHVKHRSYPEPDSVSFVVVAACKWFCRFCERCHANACPRLWGGSPEVPCGHDSEGITGGEGS